MSRSDREMFDRITACYENIDYDGITLALADVVKGGQDVGK